MSNQPQSAYTTPKPCSLYFDPIDWSPRYPETFFTANIIKEKLQEKLQENTKFTIQVRCGSLNSWEVSRTLESLAEIVKQIKHRYSGEFQFPDESGNLLGKSASVNVDELQNYLIELLSQRGICETAEIREFLELDREISINNDSEISDETNENSLSDGEGGGTVFDVAT